MRAALRGRHVVEGVYKYLQTNQVNMNATLSSSKFISSIVNPYHDIQVAKKICPFQETTSDEEISQTNYQNLVSNTHRILHTDSMSSYSAYKYWDPDWNSDCDCIILNVDKTTPLGKFCFSKKDKYYNGLLYASAFSMEKMVTFSSEADGDLNVKTEIVGFDVTKDDLHLVLLDDDTDFAMQTNVHKSSSDNDTPEKVTNIHIESIIFDGNSSTSLEDRILSNLYLTLSNNKDSLLQYANVSISTILQDEWYYIMKLEGFNDRSQSSNITTDKLLAFHSTLIDKYDSDSLDQNQLYDLNAEIRYDDFFDRAEMTFTANGQPMLWYESRWAIDGVVSGTLDIDSYDSHGVFLTDHINWDNPSCRTMVCNEYNIMIDTDMTTSFSRFTSTDDHANLGRTVKYRT